MHVEEIEWLDKEGKENFIKGKIFNIEKGKVI